jgi:hypothetical protein
MLQMSRREESFGCLFGLAGGVIGLLIGFRMHAAAVEAALSADPDDPADFLPVLPLVGLVVGALVTALFGMILGRLLPGERSRA